MQGNSTDRRSNKDRSDETRGKLIAAARALFVEKGYGETGTPEIVRAAAVTRGALYHHFADKADLFRAVVIREAETVAQEIEAIAVAAASPVDALITGGEAYFTAMTVPGRARLLLVEGPAVLGPDDMAGIDREAGGGTLRAGLEQAAAERGAAGLPLDELADLVSAAFDRAALAIAAGAHPGPYREAVRRLLLGALR